MAAILNVAQFKKNAQYAQGGIKLIFHQQGVLYQNMQKTSVMSQNEVVCHIL